MEKTESNQNKIGIYVKSLNSETYNLYQFLGKGGEGEVYKAKRISDGKDDFIVKFQFKEDSFNNAKKIMQNPIITSSTFPEFALPIDLFEQTINDIKYRGYIAKFLGISNIRDALGDINNPGFLRKAKNEVKYNALKNICDVFDKLAMNGYSYSDISANNIRIDGKAEKVYIIDCEDICPNSEVRVRKGTTYFIAPEVAFGKATCGPKTDAFAIAVLIFISLIGEYYSPYQGKATYQAQINISEIDNFAQIHTKDDAEKYLKFIFDDYDTSNSIEGSIPLGLPVHTKPIFDKIERIKNQWIQIPNVLKILFIRAFYKPLDSLSIENRPTFKEWSIAFENLLIEINTQNYYTKERENRINRLISENKYDKNSMSICLNCMNIVTSQENFCSICENSLLCPKCGLKVQIKAGKHECNYDFDRYYYVEYLIQSIKNIIDFAESVTIKKYFDRIGGLCQNTDAQLDGTERKYLELLNNYNVVVKEKDFKRYIKQAQEACANVNYDSAFEYLTKAIPSNEDDKTIKSNFETELKQKKEKTDISINKVNELLDEAKYNEASEYIKTQKEFLSSDKYNEFDNIIKKELDKIKEFDQNISNGVAEAENDNFDKARDFLSKAKDLFPDDTKKINMLSNLITEREAPVIDIKAEISVLMNESQPHSALDKLKEFFSEHQNLKKHLKETEQQINEEIKNFEEFIKKGRSKLSQGDIDSAKTNLENAQKIDKSESTQTVELANLIENTQNLIIDIKDKLAILINEFKFQEASSILSDFLLKKVNLKKHIKEEENLINNKINETKTRYDNARSLPNQKCADICLEILDLCKDYSLAEEFLKNNPPSKVNDVLISFDNINRSVNIRWESTGERVTYRVNRKIGKIAPINENEEEIIFDNSSKTVCVDENITPGLWYSYSVFAVRKDNYSQATASSIFVSAEVKNIERLQKGNILEIKWDKPENCTCISIYRNGNEIVKNAENNYNDNSIDYGDSYSYVLKANYEGMETSSGIGFTYFHRIQINPFNISKKEIEKNKYEVSWDIAETGIDIEVFANEISKYKGKSETKSCIIELEKETYYKIVVKALSGELWESSRNEIEIYTFTNCIIDDKKTIIKEEQNNGGTKIKTQIKFSNEIPTRDISFLCFVKLKTTSSDEDLWVLDNMIETTKRFTYIPILQYIKDGIPAFSSILTDDVDSLYITVYQVYTTNNNHNIYSEPMFCSLNIPININIDYVISKSFFGFLGKKKLYIKVSSNKPINRQPKLVLRACIVHPVSKIVSEKNSTVICEYPAETLHIPMKNYKKNYFINNLTDKSKVIRLKIDELDNSIKCSPNDVKNFIDKWRIIW